MGANIVHVIKTPDTIPLEPIPYLVFPFASYKKAAEEATADPNMIPAVCIGGKKLNIFEKECHVMRLKAIWYRFLWLNSLPIHDT